MGTAVHPR